MVVCYATMRYDSNFDASAAQFQVTARYFMEIASLIITNFETDTELLDTALSIIPLLGKAGVHLSGIKKKCTRLLRSGKVDSRYLEIFGLIDMEELLKLLQAGNPFIDLFNLHAFIGLNQLNTSLPNNKATRKRKHNEFEDEKMVIDASMELLNLPSCNQFVVEVGSSLLV